MENNFGSMFTAVFVAGKLSSSSQQYIFIKDGTLYFTTQTKAEGASNYTSTYIKSTGEAATQAFNAFATSQKQSLTTMASGEISTYKALISGLPAELSGSSTETYTSAKDGTLSIKYKGYSSETEFVMNSFYFVDYMPSLVYTEDEKECGVTHSYLWNYVTPEYPSLAGYTDVTPQG